MNNIIDDVRLSRAQEYLRNLPTLENGITPRSTDTTRLYCQDCGYFRDSLDPGPFVATCANCDRTTVFREEDRESIVWYCAVSFAIVLIAIALIVAGSA